MDKITYQIGEYQNGIFTHIVSGCGKNKGTWGSTHSRSAAYKHAKDLNNEAKKRGMPFAFRVLRTNID